MSKIRKKGELTFDVMNYSFLTLLTIVTVYPVIYVFLASISDAARMSAHRGLMLYPLSISLGAYKAVFQNPNILSGYGNTILYLVVGTAISMILTSLGGYALSRRNLMLGNYIMFGIVFTMLFNGGLIPLYILVKDLHMMDNIWSVTIPNAINTMNLIIMRTSFQAIPMSLEESAKIDGANDYVVFFKIMLPLSIPVIVVMILFYGVGQWNAWFYASIFLRDRKHYPLQLILREILIENGTDSMMTGSSPVDDRASIEATIKYATIIVSTLPILMVYPMLQKYFIKGVMIGAIKG